MESTNLNIRTDKQTKIMSEKIFEELGINMTTAINIFLREVIRENGIPFSLTLKPNQITLDAMAEADRIAHDKNVPGYTDMESLIAALES
jgi:DNA-damage-inducible protein J